MKKAEFKAAQEKKLQEIFGIFSAAIEEMNKHNIPTAHSCYKTQDLLMKSIYPGIIHAETIETYEDHRMAFTLIGLRVGDVKISKPNCCAKIFENYFKRIDAIS